MGMGINICVTSTHCYLLDRVASEAYEGVVEGGT